MKIISGGITAPLGFVASGIASGLKKKGLDLGLLYSERKAVCVGFFTSNRVKAAPVLLCQARMRNPFHSAVIINAGSANCLTGKKGMLDAFAALSGDYSPIHCDEQFCSKTRFKKRIGYAFLLTGFLSKLYGEHLPGGSSICIKQESKFIKPFRSNLRFLSLSACSTICLFSLMNFMSNILSFDYIDRPLLLRRSAPNP